MMMGMKEIVVGGEERRGGRGDMNHLIWNVLNIFYISYIIVKHSKKILLYSTILHTVYSTVEYSTVVLVYTGRLLSLAAARWLWPVTALV